MPSESPSNRLEASNGDWTVLDARQSRRFGQSGAGGANRLTFGHTDGDTVGNTDGMAVGSAELGTELTQLTKFMGPLLPI